MNIDNINDLEIFIEVCKSGNMSDAARKLLMTPAFISKRINILEKKLKVRLFNRTTRKISLTDKGNTLLKHAEDIIGVISDAEMAIVNSEVPNGTIKITAPASFGKKYLLNLISEYLELYKDVKIYLHLSDQRMNLNQEGYDLAFRVGELKDSGEVARLLIKHERVLCASQDYIDKYGLPLVPADLKKHNCFVLNEDSSWKFLKDGKEETVIVSGNFSSSSGEIIGEMAERGLGIAKKSIWDIYGLINEEKLVNLLPDYTILPDSGIYVLYPSAKYLPLATRKLIDLSVEYFKRNNVKAFFSS